MRERHLRGARRAVARGALLALFLALNSTQSLAAGPGGELGCLAARGDRVLEATAPDRRKTPASVHKLAVTAAALHSLGADYRVTTRVIAAGPVGADGVLRGDLILAAAGDPTWSETFFDGGAGEPLGRLARAVRGTGLERVDGDLVVDLSRFPGRPTPSSRPIGDLAFGFGAATGGLAVDANTVQLEMSPGPAVGAPARFVAEGVTVVNLTVTAPADRRDRGTVDFQAAWDDGRIVVRGEYPISEPTYRVPLAVADGEQRAASAFRDALRAAGVTVEGETRLVPGRRAERGERVVASLDSPPVGDWLRPILTDSDNWVADMLLRILAAEQAEAGRAGDGVRWLETFLEKEVGLDPDAVHLDDASGLSLLNLWTPRAVVDVLQWAHRQAWRTAYFDALARPGAGTLRAWPALPPGTRAKTGTLSHTLGLAGRLGPAEDPIFFACLLNHDIRPRPDQRRTLVERVWRWHKLTSEGRK
ncbi:MAG: D-alanyl-D-alanine carboxypeptidase/D-alanyl-D-alanine-endopeptidase [Acidobacteriota bacterium]